MPTDIFSLRADAFPHTTRVVVLRGREAISRPYRFTIDVFVPRVATLDIVAAIGTKATLEIHTGAPTPYEIHGILARIEQMLATEQGAVYRATLVPHLYALVQGEHSRVFIGQSIPDTIEQVLKDCGLTDRDYRLALQDSYPEREHVCQYRESDLAFISRWMEWEGIYYFFEQGDDHETMVITDHRSIHTSLRDTGLPYEPYADQDHGHGEALYAFRTTAQMLPESVTLEDYDWHHPELALAEQAPVTVRGHGAVNVYGQDFLTPEQGQRLASVRAEELRARQRVARGNGRAFYTRAGHTFSVEGHPTETVNVEYLATEVEHFGNQSGEILGDRAPLHRLLQPEYDDEYRVHLVAIPVEIQFRPDRSTPTPRIYGMEIGVIDGPEDSHYDQLD